MTLVTDEGQRVMEVGREVPGSDQRVVALAGGSEGWAVSGGFWVELAKPAADWRSRDLFPGQRAEVERITLRHGGRSVLLARRGEEYWVEAPFTDRADAERVEELLGALTGLRAEEFLDAPPSGLDPPQATLEVVRRGRPEPFRVAIGAAPAAAPPAATPAPSPPEPAVEPSPDADPAEPADETAAAAAPRPARVGAQVVRIAAEPLVEAATRPAEEWRSRAWTSFAVYEVDRVELRDGQGTVTLVRDEGDWKRTGTGGGEAKIFYGPVSDLLSALVDARAERVIAAGSPGAPGTAGAPALTVSLVAGEGEGGRRQTLTLGGPVAGGQLAARASDRQAVLLLPASLLADLRAKIAAVRQAEPLQPAPSTTPSPAG